MKVEVDSGRCQGHARCNVMCPEVFDLDDAGYAVVRDAHVPAALEDDVLDAVANCPEQAITTR